MARAAARVAAVPLRILRTKSGHVEVVALDDYVAAVLPGEIGRRAPAPALEAQAVAARSYALARRERHLDEGADLCDAIHCQVFRGRDAATEETRMASEATSELVLVQNGRVIAAPFHAVCGGRTRVRATSGTTRKRRISSRLTTTPAATPRASSGRTRSAGRSSRRSAPRSASRRRASSRSTRATTRAESPSVRFVAPGGRSVTLRGFDFRRGASELWGWATVRSTAFEVTESRTEYLLTGRGTGHGAGMCQAGAIARARREETRDAIWRFTTGARRSSASQVDSERAARSPRGPAGSRDEDRRVVETRRPNRQAKAGSGAVKESAKEPVSRAHPVGRPRSLEVGIADPFSHGEAHIIKQLFQRP